MTYNDDSLTTMMIIDLRPLNDGENYNGDDLKPIDAGDNYVLCMMMISATVRMT